MTVPGREHAFRFRVQDISDIADHGRTTFVGPSWDHTASGRGTGYVLNRRIIIYMTMKPNGPVLRTRNRTMKVKVLPTGSSEEIDEDVDQPHDDPKDFMGSGIFLHS